MSSRVMNGRTIAQWWCLGVGAVLLLVGALGFVAESSFDTTETGLDGGSLLGFEVNGWHNLVHIASGLFLLAMSSRWRNARLAAIAFGVIYGAVTVVGMIDGADVFGLMPVNDADNVLHLVLSAGSILAGLVAPGDAMQVEPRRGTGHVVAAGATAAADAPPPRTGRFSRDATTTPDRETERTGRGR